MSWSAASNRNRWQAGARRCLGRCRRQIHPTAELRGRIFINHHTEIARDARINGTVSIGSRCRIGEGATVEDAIIFRGTVIEPGRPLRAASSAITAWSGLVRTCNRDRWSARKASLRRWWPSCRRAAIFSGPR